MQLVVCHMVLRDSSAVKFDRVEIAFIWVLFYWLKSLTDEAGEETGVPEKKPQQNKTKQQPKKTTTNKAKTNKQTNN